MSTPNPLQTSSTTNNENNLLPKGWDRYRKVRELGQGSYGVVYLAADTTLEPSLQQEQQGNVHPDFYVAVKCVSLAGASESESSNALREVAIIRNLDHPNILRCLDVFVDSHENLCTVTEFIDGGDLSDMISKCNSNHQSRNTNNNKTNKSSSNPSHNQNDNFSYQSETSSLPSYRQPDHGALDGKRFYVDAIAIVDIAEQILKGLSYLHSQRILHRDIKPANLFVTSSGVVKIGDFGISRVVQQSIQASSSQQNSLSTRSNRTLVGTPFYLSPESLLGSKYSFPSDVWSFGVLMYELYCGVPPFTARNVLALVNIITQGEYDQERLAARPYRSGLNVNSATQNLSATEAAGGISEQVQKEVCDAVVNIIKASLVLDPSERPSARQMLLKFFTEDPEAPINPEVELYGDPSVNQGSVGTMSTEHSLLSNNNTTSRQQINNNNPTFTTSPSFKPAHDTNDDLIMKEMESVVRSSGMKIQQENNNNTLLTSVSSSSQQGNLQENRSVLLVADTEIVDVPREENSVIKRHGDENEEDEYEDDFEEDILSTSVMKRNKDNNKKSANDGDDHEKDDKNGNTRVIAEKVDALPWVSEAKVFELIPLDDISGHGPLFIIRKEEDEATSARRAARRGSSVATVTTTTTTTNSSPSPAPGGGARPSTSNTTISNATTFKNTFNTDPKQHFVEPPPHAEVSPTSSSSPQISLNSQHQHQLSNQRRMSYLQQHHGEHSDLVCEIATPSRLSFMNNNNKDANAAKLVGRNNPDTNSMVFNNSSVVVGGIDVTCSSVKLHPVLRAGLIAEHTQNNEKNQNQQPENLSLRSHQDPSLHTFKTSASATINTTNAHSIVSSAPQQQSQNQQQRPQMTEEQIKENYEATQKRIRERAMIFHKKRLNALAKEREAYKKEMQENQQQQQQESSPSRFQIPSSVPPLGGFAKPSALDPSTLVHNKSSQHQHQHHLNPSSHFALENSISGAGQPPLLRRPSRVLGELVDARHRGLVSGALLSAFPHLLPRPHSEYKSARGESNNINNQNSTTNNSLLSFNNNQQTSFIPNPDTSRLAAAAQGILQAQQQKQQESSQSRNSGNEYDGTSSSDDEEEEDSDDDDDNISDDDEEEEEEESDIDDEEFRVKVHFSAETCQQLKATEFDPNHFGKLTKKVGGSTKKPASSSSSKTNNINFTVPKSFPSFSIKFHLFSDDAYSKLLKAVQDRVIFYGEAEKLVQQATAAAGVGAVASAGAAAGATSEDNTSSKANKKSSTKKSSSSTSKLSATNFLLASTNHLNNNNSLLAGSLTVSTQCVPLSFEYVDGSDKLVFDRKADWNCVREQHLDSRGMDAVMHLYAIPR